MARACFVSCYFYFTKLTKTSKSIILNFYLVCFDGVRLFWKGWGLDKNLGRYEVRGVRLTSNPPLIAVEGWRVRKRGCHLTSCDVRTLRKLRPQ
jgi:hypothetical protein